MPKVSRSVEEPHTATWSYLVTVSGSSLNGDPDTYPYELSSRWLKIIRDF